MQGREVATDIKKPVTFAYCVNSGGISATKIFQIELSGVTRGNVAIIPPRNCYASDALNHKNANIIHILYYFLELNDAVVSIDLSNRLSLVRLTKRCVVFTLLMGWEQTEIPEKQSDSVARYRTRQGRQQLLQGRHRLPFPSSNAYDVSCSLMPPTMIPEKSWHELLFSRSTPIYRASQHDPTTSQTTRVLSRGRFAS